VLPTYGDELATFGDADPATTRRRYREVGAAEVAVKNGEAPALLAFDATETEVEANRGQMVDATGAGDSFNGTYLAARLEGADPVEAARRAHKVAGIVIGHRGALVDPALVR
jgi:2-dehydro-3-deoxygluconokinase